jgi:hypothetical protein
VGFITVSAIAHAHIKLAGIWPAIMRQVVEHSAQGCKGRGGSRGDRRAKLLLFRGDGVKVAFGFARATGQLQN